MPTSLMLCSRFCAVTTISSSVALGSVCCARVPHGTIVVRPVVMPSSAGIVSIVVNHLCPPSGSDMRRWKRRARSHTVRRSKVWFCLTALAGRGFACFPRKSRRLIGSTTVDRVSMSKVVEFAARRRSPGIERLNPLSRTGSSATRATAADVGGRALERARWIRENHAHAPLADAAAPHRVLGKDRERVIAGRKAGRSLAAGAAAWRATDGVCRTRSASATLNRVRHHNCRRDRPWVLIVDDAHRLRGSAGETLLREVILHRPAAMRIVIAARGPCRSDCPSCGLLNPWWISAQICCGSTWRNCKPICLRVAISFHGFCRRPDARH